MRRWAVLGCVVLIAGCATRPFVRTEAGRAEERLAAQVARLEAAVAAHRARVDAVVREVTAERAAMEEAARRAGEAATAARRGEDRAADAIRRAGATVDRAGAAEALAREAMARAGATDQRLTRVREGRGRRALVDTVLVHFGFDRWSLDDRAETTLLDVARQLRARPELVVELEGYTDDLGDVPYNLRLSERRADSVRRFLAVQGVALARIHAIGYGEVRPVADNKTREGRDQNRRVAVRLVARLD